MPTDTSPQSEVVELRAVVELQRGEAQRRDRLCGPAHNLGDLRRVRKHVLGAVAVVHVPANTNVA